MNNKGFAISGIIYGILVIFLLLVFCVLGILVNRKVSLDRIKANAYNTVMGQTSNDLPAIPNLIADWNKMYINSAVSSYTDKYLLLNVKSPTGLNVINNTSFTFGSLGEVQQIKYQALDISSNVVAELNKDVEEVSDAPTYDFKYTGSVQKKLLLPGVYKIELWGASGGDIAKAYSNPGHGGYTSGILVLDKVTLLYFYVGGKGSSNTTVSKANTQIFLGGYNGGGAGAASKIPVFSSGGGGATDVRVSTGDWNNIESLNSRIMVAGGGGGASCQKVGGTTYSGNGGSGGNIIGGNGTTTSDLLNGYGGTQVSGGFNYAGIIGSSERGFSGQFGIGGNGTQFSAGGGGGYYGGGASNQSGAGGGSSFISGYTGCVAPTSKSNSAPISGCATGSTNASCSYHYSGLIFQNGIMRSGSEAMPNYSENNSMTGNEGNGYARITSLIYYE